MRPADFESFKVSARQAVEARLELLLTRPDDTVTLQVARYLVLGGGHRWRAMAAMAAGLIFDDRAMSTCLAPACSVEMAHAATLLLDDLPSMDNAFLRRGKPCAHRVFPDWAVDMAAALLINEAYEAMLTNSLVSPEARIATSEVIARAARQMNLGQELDLIRNLGGDEAARLLDCYRLKSGSLYGAAARAGAVVSGASDGEPVLLEKCGLALGVSYQLLDDIADVEAQAAEVGKSPGMDEGKQTGIDVFGLEGCRQQADRFQAEALAHLESFGPRADLMRSLVGVASWAPI